VSVILMRSLLKRVRWAVVLAVLQGSIFATVGLVEHRRHYEYVHSRPGNVEASFGCMSLPRTALSKEAREEAYLWSLYGDCWDPLYIKYVEVTNLPVFLAWAIIRVATESMQVDQFRLFYVFHGVGIPLFWYWMGALIDRRPRETKTQVRDKPPSSQ